MREISSIEDLLIVTRETVGNFGETWWRGQPAGKSLIPGAYRDRATHRMEWRRMTRFMQKAGTRYPNVPGPEQYAEWLFLMQHHRLPTRLLDWTESPLIASLFAVIDDNEQDGCLWALSPYELNSRHMMSILPGHGLIHPDAIPVMFEIPFKEPEFLDPPYDRVVAILTTEKNVRMLQQQSALTLHGTKVPLDQLPEKDNFLRSFRIPSCAKTLIYEDLLRLGIRESSLFPDLDHLAGDICRTIGPTA